MKPLAAVVLLVTLTFAADYPLTAHVIASTKHRVGGGDISAYNNKTGWTYGEADSKTVREIEMQAGNRIYMIEKRCKVSVGEDYPARVDEKRIHLQLPNGKTCDARIRGVREAK